MKKFNFLLALGLVSSISMNAQTTIASVGFETGDAKYTTANAYTPGGTYGDWVNRVDGDVWSETNTNAHSGEYCMMLQNSSAAGNTWDRGFKIGNLHLKENTSYRVSFWVKAEPNYIDENGNETTTRVKSSISIGREYCDMPITTKGGLQYYYNYLNSMTGNWRRISYLTYFTNKADQDNFSINYTGKADPYGVIVVPQSDPFPDEYFVTINMYSPMEYYLDDIKVEENATFNEATFLEDAIKLDFGYPTNIADLAKDEGTFSLDPSCASVTVNGEAVVVKYLEGKKDGYLYAFLENPLKETDEVKVSFAPSSDCPIKYNNDKRPSADVVTEMTVLGFEGETAYYDELIEAIPEVMSAPRVVSTVPENESFELENLNVVSFTFDKEVSLEYASAYLRFSDNFGDQEEDYTEDMTLSEDKKTVYVDITGLEDGEYTVALSDIENTYGIGITEDCTVTFAIGKDSDETTSETIFATDFDNQMTGGVPCGWLTENEAGIHLYGFNDEERTSQYNYNWGGTPGGGGARLYEGFSGDFKKAMYWGTRGTDLGYASYGELVKDYLNPNGTLSDDAPEGISLYLEPRKYQISFLMAAWKNEPTFTFTLEDLNANVYAKFTDIVAAPNANGQTTYITGSVKCQTDFTVNKAGFYVLKFTSFPAQWQEFLLANVKLITMPSKAAYYRQLLKVAAEKAEIVYNAADGPEYDGDTKTALGQYLNSAQNDTFNSGSAIEALIEKLETYSAALEKRVNNIDNYFISIIEAQSSLDELEEKYKNTEMAKELAEYIAEYADVNPSTLPDAILNEVSTNLTNAAAKISNIKSIIDILTWGAFKSSIAAQNMGVDSTPVDELSDDNRDVINKVNGLTTAALYQKIINKENLEKYMTKVYDDQHGNPDSEDGDPNYDENGFPLLITGIDLTGYIKNPKFYTYATDANAPLQDNTIVGWNVEQFTTTDEEGNQTVVGSVHISGTAASASNPVTDVSINAYGSGCEYKFYQTIENLPVGIYDVYLGSRTGQNSYTPEGSDEAVTIDFNGYDEATGLWDKYIFAQADGESMMTTPFAAGASGVHATVIKNVTVKEGQKLTIGAIEHYTSGKAEKNGQPTTMWDTNTYVDDARIYFVAPLEGYDYANALATEIASVSNSKSNGVLGIYSVTGAKLSNYQKGINIIKMSDNTIRKVIKK